MTKKSTRRGLTSKDLSMILGEVPRTSAPHALPGHPVRFGSGEPSSKAQKTKRKR